MAATAAVFLDGRRAGSAVLVDPRHLVTAAHVLRRADPGNGAAAHRDQVELEFPSRTAAGNAGRATAAPVDLGPAGQGIDVAVLDLGADPPGWLPVPVSVWPAARPPPVVQVFGYPLAERSLSGVWQNFTVAGPTTAGTVQLDWAGDTGTFPGHSGGPVIDSVGHMLAGILVEGAERGHFDRFVPVTLIAQVWPQLPRCWLMVGAGQADARDHFTRRAYGQVTKARGGDLFRGRENALAAIHDSLCAVEPPGQALVITGQPGAGKSAVLARAALTLETEQVGPGLAFHASGATVSDFLTAVADLTGVDPPGTADQLVDALAGLQEDLLIRMVVDALDEAASDAERRQMTKALTELAVLPRLRVAIATRARATDARYMPGELLADLDISGPDCPNLVDLDTDTY